MTSYLDTSFLWKLYVHETHSPRVLDWFLSRQDILVISDLSDVEMTSALYRRLSPDKAAEVRAIYEDDQARGAFRKLQMDRSIFVLAENLAENYAGKYGLRSLDALHIAVALHSGAEAIGTFDGRLQLAAIAAGLSVIEVGK